MLTIDSSIKSTIQRMAMESLRAEIETLGFNDCVSNDRVYYEEKNKKFPKGENLK